MTQLACVTIWHNMLRVSTYTAFEKLHALVIREFLAQSETLPLRIWGICFVRPWIWTHWLKPSSPSKPFSLILPLKAATMSTSAYQQVRRHDWKIWLTKGHKPEDAKRQINERKDSSVRSASTSETEGDWRKAEHGSDAEDVDLESRWLNEMGFAVQIHKRRQSSQNKQARDEGD
jgi:hypothetical protein